MERLENRHNSDTQTAIFEETSDTLSIADMLKRTLERTITSGEDMTRSLGQTARNQKLPPATLIKFLIAAEGGSLAKELHRAGIDATPAAVSQRRRQIPPAVFRKVFWTSHPPVHTVSPIAATKATVFWPVTAPQSIWPATLARPASFAITAHRGGTINYI